MRNAIAMEALPETVVKWCQDLGFKVKASFKPSGDEEMFPNRLVLEGPDAQWLMANKGQALDALQFLVHEVQNERDEAKQVYLDVESYRLFRMNELKAMAMHGIQRAKEMGSHTFQSLTPRERRWVHLTIARHGMQSESEGTGHLKSLKITKP